MKQEPWEGARAMDLACEAAIGYRSQAIKIIQKLGLVALEPNAKYALRVLLCLSLAAQAGSTHAQ